MLSSAGQEAGTYTIWVKDPIDNATQLGSYVFKTVEFELNKDGGTAVIPAPCVYVHSFQGIHRAFRP